MPPGLIRLGSKHNDWDYLGRLVILNLGRPFPQKWSAKVTIRIATTQSNTKAIIMIGIISTGIKTSNQDHESLPNSLKVTKMSVSALKNQDPNFISIVISTPIPMFDV